ncbi:MAG: hypothetical protein RSD47_08520, partial [Romboutsia sp.]
MLSDWHLIESITTPKEVWGDTMRSTIIYNFPYKPFYRNFGFYHEGGMYAIFLNIALLFSYRIEKLKNINIIRIILIITIATTLSTTGMIGAVLIIVLSIRNNKNLIKSIITFIVLIVIIIYIEGKLGIISNKFNIDNESFNARSSEV